MKPELTSKEIIAACDYMISISKSSDSAPLQNIDLAINRGDGHIQLRNAAGMVDDRYWSIDAAAFLSREELLALEEHNAYTQEVDKYIADEPK